MLSFVRKDKEECQNILIVCKELLASHGVNFEIEKLLSDSREADLVFARALIAAYLRKRKFSLIDISIVLNRKSHATIMNLLRYKHKKTGRYARYDEIIKAFTTEETQKELQQRLAYHLIKASEIRKLIDQPQQAA